MNVSGASAIPYVLFSMVGGSAADRLSRRAILVWTQVAQMIQAFVLAVLATNRWVPVQPWHIAVLAAMNGVVNAYLLPAQMAFITEMVDEPEALSNAIWFDKSFDRKGMSKEEKKVIAIRGAEASQQEELWQASRVIFYYMKEHPEYKLESDTVGNKIKWSDASLPPDELVKLAKRNSRVYLNPNFPVEELLKGARIFPSVSNAAVSILIKVAAYWMPRLRGA